MNLFRITLRTLFARKTWVLAVICVAVLPFLLPLLVPSEFALGLVEPARAQAAWVLLWAVTLLWLIGQASLQGQSNAKSGLGLYFTSMGLSKSRQLLEIWMAHVVYLVPLVVLAILVCWLGATPSDSSLGKDWLTTNFQYGALFLLVTLPLLMFAVALGSRFGALVAYLVTIGLAGYGLVGVGYLEFATRMEGNVIVQFVYSLSPHYHLADLTERLVFRMGSLEAKTFATIATYLFGIMLIMSGGSLAAFRTTAKA